MSLTNAAPHIMTETKTKWKQIKKKRDWIKRLYLEPAEDGGRSAVQRVPPPVSFVHHRFELAGSVGAVLPGQPAVLIVDQLQLGQLLMNVPLETLKKRNI